MAETRRRLAAILAADVAGYSRLMGDDEAATVSMLNTCRDVFRTHVGERSGRVVDTAGDSVLAIFDSVVEATECAVSVQTVIAAKNAALTDDRTMNFRVGVNLGDVIEQEDGSIYGDGVNVAARLEGLAEPGGICLSGSAYEQVEGKTDYGFESIGTHDVKNIARPVRAWRLVAGKRARTSPPNVVPAPSDRPSIAVLAFENLSGDSEQEYFADGISEDLITELSRLRWLQVTARNSSFSYKGQAPDIRDVGRDLGVRYVVEGSVRKGGNRVRITAQLIDAASGNHIWAERYDRDLADVFALQDEITETLVAALQDEVGEFERERAHRKPPRSLDAWEAYQRGMWHLYRFDGKDLPEARRLLRAAMDLDSGFAQPYAAMGFSYFMELTNFSDEFQHEKLGQALRYASQAVALDDKDALAHFMLGRLQTMRGDYATAIAESRIAIGLNPSLAPAHYGLGVALWWNGQPEDAIAELDTAIRLSPRDPIVWAAHNMRAFARLAMGDYEAAVDDARQATRVSGSTYWPQSMLVSALALLGKQEDARNALDKLLEIKPDYTLDAALAGYSPLRPEALKPRIRTFIDGLRKAGLDVPDEPESNG